MSDTDNNPEAQQEPRITTIAHMAEPPAEVAADGPPSAPRVEVLQPETSFVRFGGVAGVRVQQLGAASVTRVSAGADVFDAFVRVRRDTIIAVRSAVDAAESLDELQALVRSLLADTFSQL